jgi:hypothetical protein
VTPAEEWARCRAWIASALPYCGGTHTIADIEAGIEDGTMVFFPGEHCALVLVIEQSPRMKDLVVFLGGGERNGKTVKEYRERLDPELIRFGKLLSCDRIKHYCRDGGVRVGERLGYQKLCTVMVKDIE